MTLPLSTTAATRCQSNTLSVTVEPWMQPEFATHTVFASNNRGILLSQAVTNFSFQLYEDATTLADDVTASPTTVDLAAAARCASAGSTSGEGLCHCHSVSPPAYVCPHASSGKVM